MKTNTIQQMNRGMDVCPLAKDRAITSLVMKSERLEDSPNPAYAYGAHSHEDDSPSSFVRNLRAGRDMRLHI